LILQPRYRSDLNPAEQLSAKFKHRLRKAAERSIDAVDDAIGCIPDTVIHHGDNDREFVVTPVKGLFYCVSGCGGGDAITLVSKVKDMHPAPITFHPVATRASAVVAPR
jgi:hypothetical protein